MNNNEDVYRTAPATPGLLIKENVIENRLNTFSSLWNGDICRNAPGRQLCEQKGADRNEASWRKCTGLSLEPQAAWSSSQDVTIPQLASASLK